MLDKEKIGTMKSFYGWRGRRLFNHRALIIGAGRAGRTIAQALMKHSNNSFQIIGFVDDDPAKEGAVIYTGTLNFPSYKVLGNRLVLSELIAQHNVTTLIVAINQEVDSKLEEILAGCMELGLRNVSMPVLYEQLTGRVPIDYVGDNWYMAMPLQHPGTRLLNRLIKRISDIILASVGVLCLAPVFPFLALAIYLDSPGPIFYSQSRVGKGGRLFKAYKFRSMVPDAERQRAVWAQKNDPRVTRVGRFLRKTHIDEFPQFINIFKGEMSAVGPRAERPEFVQELEQEIPFYDMRHAVKPGMAGWGLVKQGYGASIEDARVKLEYDLYYIKHQSLWLDIVILLKTIVDTVTLRGR